MGTFKRAIRLLPCPRVVGNPYEVASRQCVQWCHFFAFKNFHWHYRVLFSYLAFWSGAKYFLYIFYNLWPVRHQPRWLFCFQYNNYHFYLQIKLFCYHFSLFRYFFCFFFSLPLICLFFQTRRNNTEIKHLEREECILFFCPQHQLRE